MAIEQENVWKKFGKGNFSDVNSVKIVPDKLHQYRILPQKKGEKYALFEFSSHWIEQQTGVRYPIFHEKGKKDCKICNYVQSLWADVNQMKEDGMTDESPEIKAKKTLIYACRATDTFDANVLDRNEYQDLTSGEIQVKRWTFGKQIFSPIHELAIDEEWGSPSHDENGYDIKVVGHKQGQQGLQYTVTGSKNSSPLTPEEIEALNKKGYDLSKIRTKEFIPETKVKEIVANAKLKEIQSLYKNVVVDNDDDEDDDDSVVTIKQKEEIVAPTLFADEPVEKKQTGSSKKTKSKKVDEENEEIIQADDDQEDFVAPVKTPQIDSDKKSKKIDDDLDNDDLDLPNSKMETIEKEEEPAEEKESEEENTSEHTDEEIEEFNSYECKGLYDSTDQACTECDHIDQCQNLASLAKKAEAMGVDPRKDDLLMTEAEIKDLMKNKSTPVKGRKMKKDINF